MVNRFDLESDTYTCTIRVYDSKCSPDYRNESEASMVGSYCSCMEVSARSIAQSKETQTPYLSPIANKLTQTQAKSTHEPATEELYSAKGNTHNCGKKNCPKSRNVHMQEATRLGPAATPPNGATGTTAMPQLVPYGPGFCPFCRFAFSPEGLPICTAPVCHDCHPKVCLNPSCSNNSMKKHNQGCCSCLKKGNKGHKKVKKHKEHKEHKMKHH